MSNSSLVTVTKLSPNHSGKRTHAVDRITPHCVVGQLSALGIANCFPAGREASCNYGVGKDGDVALIVDEANRSWCSSSNANDQRAITIECASDTKHPYAFTDKCYNKLVDLCEDICRRYGKKKLLWFGDKTKTLSYAPKSDEMVLTVHRWFAAKACPGDWMYNRMGELAITVTNRLGGNTVPTGTLYHVQVGAYSKKENADNMLKKVKSAGFDAFVKHDTLYRVQVGAYSQKANADAMLKKVQAAGFDAFISKSLAAPTPTEPPKKSVDEIAREVIRGLWGNGQERKDRLTAAGYDYNAVQNRVNELL